jgi:elongator complex protein 3
MRMQRDIPAPKIAAGVKNGNLHQMVIRELEKRGQKCRCIRCREVFSPYRKDENNKNKTRNTKQKPLNLQLVKREYSASGGEEHFLSYEDIDEDLLAGFIRLRFPPNSHRPEIDSHTALIRELHVYGSEFSIGADKIAAGHAAQHQGIGKALLQEAEEMSREAGKSKMLIISGVGVRDYYRKFGYGRDGPYMGKKL